MTKEGCTKSFKRNTLSFLDSVSWKKSLPREKRSELKKRAATNNSRKRRSAKRKNRSKSLLKSAN